MVWLSPKSPNIHSGIILPLLSVRIRSTIWPSRTNASLASKSMVQLLAYLPATFPAYLPGCSLARLPACLLSPSSNTLAYRQTRRKFQSQVGKVDTQACCELPIFCRLRVRLSPTFCPEKQWRKLFFPKTTTTTTSTTTTSAPWQFCVAQDTRGKQRDLNWPISPKTCYAAFISTPTNANNSPTPIYLLASESAKGIVQNASNFEQATATLYYKRNAPVARSGNSHRIGAQSKRLLF